MLLARSLIHGLNNILKFFLNHRSFDLHGCRQFFIIRVQLFLKDLKFLNCLNTGEMFVDLLHFLSDQFSDILMSRKAFISGISDLIILRPV